jgi:3-methyladenine DNA glycosylase AlkD
MWQKVIEQIIAMKNDEKAVLKAKFFKTAPGQYGEGDLFLGLTNPQLHVISKQNRDLLEILDLEHLMTHPYHEIRQTALNIMVLKYKKAKKQTEKEEILKLYIASIPYINNWDLVDCSSHYMLGPYALEFEKEDLIRQLIKKDHIWSERIAIIAMLHYVRKNSFDFPFEIIHTKLTHTHDLIHKANGWVLREIWQKGQNHRVENYLIDNIKIIPRTTLRYAIEKMDESKRKYFLNLK